ncbi:MAG TPA: DUF4091 domain-containing protein [Phycisphaerae bacterium]|jgi:hypothetical protein|nr:DUF4091 domain-containing protein [Phycisphaerae bacterium]HOJ53552.1 DUF4091 domain-containing protein [Phycisphaerae bacterium]HOL25291.1 DUF4091 domain-containing protein [Phycisphaerae bacterium]HPP20494.1 DUF4091 domain-containing protein [Phycisphaerae bacterium]HPU32212.1 DUF4091 domain-containing protein [Phycisphaerae bacterium]
MPNMYRFAFLLSGTLVLLASGSIGLAAPGGACPVERVNSVLIPEVTSPAALVADLDQAPWSQAAVLTGFVDIKGRQLASQPTWVYVAYDREALWLGFRCEGPGAQTEPTIRERDGRVWGDESVEVLLDPGDAHGDAFHLVVNSAGIIYDSVGRDSGWDSGLEVRTARDAAGWTLAARLPFSSLRVARPAPGTQWAGNFCRNAGGVEKSSWCDSGGDFVDGRKFGHIIFGGATIRPARFRHIAPLVMGPNTIRFDPLEGGRFELHRLDGRQRVLALSRGALSGLSDALWMNDDNVRWIALQVQDGEGRLLSASRYPMESPQVAGRLERLWERFCHAEKTLERFPASLRKPAGELIEEAREPLRKGLDILHQRERYSASRWRELDETVTAWQRKLNALCAYAETLGFADQAGFAVGLESPMRKVMIRDFPFEGRIAGHYDLWLARNEHEAVQVVLIPFAHDLRRASVTVAPAAAGARPFPGAINVLLVGHVRVAENTPYEVSYRGWWPDPLLDFQKECDIAAGEQVAFWVDVATRPDTPGGDYEVVLVAQARDCPPVHVRLKIHVWDVELPTGTHLRNAFTYNYHQVRAFYRERWTEQMARKYHDLILDHRLNIDHLYRKQPPDIELLEYCRTRGLNAFNVKFVGKGTGKEALSQVLDDYLPRISELGLLDAAYLYGFDEDPGDGHPAMRELYTYVHQRYPGLKTMTTAYDRSFGRDTGLREAVDIWVPLTSHYNLEEARRLRAEGKDMWWYVCLRPHEPYANWFIEYPAIHARLLLGCMSYKYEVGGFLYYLIAGWQNNHRPIDSGPYTKWNPGSCDDRHGRVANGDGSLICPGPDGPLSTIRLENIRDGLEDYEYLYALARIVDQIKLLPATAQGSAFVDKANALLSVPPAVVHTLTDYTLEPHELENFRRSVAEAIIQGRGLMTSSTRSAP